MLVLVVMGVCAMLGATVAASLAAYAQTHWKRRPEDPSGGGTQADFGLAG